MKDSTYYIAVARALVGENVTDGTFDADIVKVYNAKSGYTYDGEGCSETAATVAIKAGVKSLCPMANWAAGQITQARSKGIYSTAFKSYPCLMYVSTANNGTVDHTTVVVGKSGKYYVTVEGNIGKTKAVVSQKVYKTSGDARVICFATPKFTGALDTDTIKDWQKAAIKDGASITADGDYGTYSKKYAKTVEIKDGTTSAQAKWLQQWLKDLGYYTGTVDGECGSYTVSAIKAFQTAEGLTVDGWCGQNMLEHILID